MEVFTCNMKHSSAPFFSRVLLFFMALILLIGCRNEDPEIEEFVVIPDPDPQIRLVSNAGSERIQTAVDHTFDIWEDKLLLSASIRVNVIFIAISPGFLGRAIPNGHKNFPNAQYPEVWYPSSLAKQLAGGDLNPDDNDMDILIDGTRNWYFGTDGLPNTGQYDFVTLLLHEIGHGLGLGTLAGIEGREGAFSIQPELGLFTPSFDVPELQNLPTVFDLFLQNNDSELLTTAYPNPSEILGKVFVSDQVFFAGQRTLVINGTPAKIYAPDPFRDGSSISHLDERLYNDSPNALMTPFLSEMEVNHDPGPLTLAILEDLGWSLK